MIEPDVVRRHVGIVGAGQLARMMGDAAPELGLTLTVLATAADDSAVATCDHVILGSARDGQALDQLSEQVDVVTFDHELVDLEQIRALEARGVVVRPSAAALAFAVDKAHQRRVFQAEGLPVPAFVVVSSADDPALLSFLDQHGGRAVVKAATGGYDGRGVQFAADRDAALAMVREVSAAGDVVVEEMLTLRSEVAQMVVRGHDGDVRLYPLVTTVQQQAMCADVRYPATVSPELAAQAAVLGQRIAELIGLVGVMAVEFFETPDGLMINELALRPHNSGHWTIEGTVTSQFANHLRAVSGLALGSTEAVAPAAVMVNVVGSDTPSDLAAAAAVAGVFVHDYGKAWRPGRKLGHVTAVGVDPTEVKVRAWKGARAYGTSSQETP
jgi:5-(carboxyamino)imidazole ribonucleotide synthase